MKLNRSLDINNFCGFTLIELILVMGVISTLAVIVVSSYPSARRKARDSQRMNDIKQYQTALEVYANANNGVYPNMNNQNLDNMCSTGIITLSTCPLDPNDNHYLYTGNGLGNFVYGELEVTENNATQWFVVCSDGRSDTTTNDPSSSATCPL